MPLTEVPCLTEPRARRSFQAALLRWFDRHRRELPWRANAHPYGVWLSEIMLQQTRVATVLEYYARFLRRFPDVAVLARARTASVLASWSGLGYYRRARRMQTAAQQIVRERGGQFPQTSAEWRELPGIGRYTAAAIASICSGEPCAVVDGNVRRVLQRLQRSAQEDVWTLADRLLSRRRPGDFNQAMMELGATVCTPSTPKCQACPVREWCESKSPAARPKLERHTKQPRVRVEARYLLIEKNGRVLLVQRNRHESVMPGMWELPAGHQRDGKHFVVRHAIMNTEYRVLVTQTTSAGLELEWQPSGAGKWFPITRAAKLPLTGLARKVLERVYNGGFARSRGD